MKNFIQNLKLFFAICITDKSNTEQSGLREEVISAPKRSFTQDEGALVIQRTKSEESQNQEILRYAQDNKEFYFSQERENTVSHAKHTVKNLFAYLPIHLFTLKHAAFTLAEVLITLAIIGVVAALTLPTLISNHQKQTYVNQLKKAVNTIENAANMAVAKEGASSFENTSLSALFDEYFYYVNQDLNRNNIKKVLTEYFEYSTLHLGETAYSIPQYKNLSGTDRRIGNGGEYKMILSDGTILYFLSSREFAVDVNGFKGPNVYGRDFFYLMIDKNGKIYNHHYDSDKYYEKIVADGWKMNY